jgi:predicted metal-binding protein
MEGAMESLDRYIAWAKEKGVTDAVVVQPAKVYTAPWVTLKCRYGCFNYGKSHCCPPRTPTADETRRVLDCYSRAILLHEVWEGGTRDIRDFNTTVVDLEITLFLDGYHKAWSMGSGPCRRCEQCNVEGSCVHGNRARPSMEACGIDVFDTAAENGLAFRVLKDRDERRNSFGLVLVE